MILYEDVNRANKLIKTSYILDILSKKYNIKPLINKSDDRKLLTFNDFDINDAQILKSHIKQYDLNSKDVINYIKNNESYNKIKKLLNNNPGYIYPFLYFYCVELIDYDDLVNAYKDLIKYKDILDKMPKKFDSDFIDVNKKNNFEILIDNLNFLKNYKKIKTVYDRLTQKLKQEYNNSTQNIKNEFNNACVLLYDSVYNENNIELFNKTYKLLFNKIKKYNNIKDVINLIKDFIKSNNNKNTISKFYDHIRECNNKYAPFGVDVVFDKNGIIILRIKSYEANKFINSDTSHCIKDSFSNWKHYVDDDCCVQYYIYNFNIDITDPKSVIGITITNKNENKIKACFLKNDEYYLYVINHTLREWEIEYDLNTDLLNNVLKPMDKNEYEIRKKIENIETLIKNNNKIPKNINVSDILNKINKFGIYVKSNFIYLIIYCVIIDDFSSLVYTYKYFDKLGWIDKNQLFKNVTDHIKSLNVLKFFIKNGLKKLSKDNYDLCYSDIDFTLKCINKNIIKYSDMSGYPLRLACYGNYKNKKNIGNSYFEIFKKLSQKINSINHKKYYMSSMMIIASKYGRLDIIKYIHENYKMILDDRTYIMSLNAAKTSVLIPREISKIIVNYIKNNILINGNK